MGKLRKKFNAFVRGLSEKECRKELVNAYMMMERCMKVLQGEEVEPVTMMDNGESSDLELFYMCKKIASEKALLEEKAAPVGDFRFAVDVRHFFARPNIVVIKL